MYEFTKADKLFRLFQIQKFDPKRLSPTASLTIDMDVTKLNQLIREHNETRRKNSRITLTHLLLKAAADELINFKILYAGFNGKKIISNPKLILNIPIDIENHVEYVIIHDPNKKTLADIIKEFNKEIEKINKGEGSFHKHVQQIMKVPYWLRRLVIRIPGMDIKYMRKHYGNFVITNVGTLGIKNATTPVGRPIISGLCIGKMEKQIEINDEGEIITKHILQVTIVFDHRPIDGGYVSRFLNALKKSLEKPDYLFKKI